MSRPPSVQEILPEGWDITKHGMEAWATEVDKFEDALFGATMAKTKSRGSKSLDAPEIQEASRFLLVGLPIPQWKRVLRISMALVYVAGGWFFRQALREGISHQEFVMFLVGGIFLRHPSCNPSRNCPSITRFPSRNFGGRFRGRRVFPSSTQPISNALRKISLPQPLREILP